MHSKISELRSCANIKEIALTLIILMYTSSFFFHLTYSYISKGDTINTNMFHIQFEIFLSLEISLIKIIYLHKRTTFSPSEIFCLPNSLIDCLHAQTRIISDTCSMLTPETLVNSSVLFPFCLYEKSVLHARVVVFIDVLFMRERFWFGFESKVF